MQLSDDMRYFDITPQLSEKLAVFPGDTPFKRQIHLDFKKGDLVYIAPFAAFLASGLVSFAHTHFKVWALEETLRQGALRDPLAPNSRTSMGEAGRHRPFLGHPAYPAFARSAESPLFPNRL